MALINQTPQDYYEGSAYGDYQFTSIANIVNAFMMAYVGENKIISKIKRTDVLFHASRAIQEFSFDLLPSTKAIEIEMGPALTMTLPQDYVNYVKFSWSAEDGTERIIYPTRDTSNPTAPIQDNNYEYTFDANGELITAAESTTLSNFQKAGYDNTGDAALNMSDADVFNLYRYGNRYGLNPENAQMNGVVYIDQLNGVARFSSNLAGRIVTLKYVSDGLGHEEDMKVHKMAEDAIYKYIAHAILATRANVPEYQVARYKKEMVAAKRNAKLRLSNLKIAELAQVMRNQSKWIKH